VGRTGDWVAVHHAKVDKRPTGV